MVDETIPKAPREGIGQEADQKKGLSVPFKLS